jgi:polyisoprenoid-binding protein YceI
MDKNTYKALNTTNFSSIDFTAASVDIKPSGNVGYILTTKGKLTIAGTSRDVSLSANGIVNPDKSITYSGTYHLKMTEYKVDPPTAMLGTIKTGDDIVVKFNMVLKVL